MIQGQVCVWLLDTLRATQLLLFYKHPLSPAFRQSTHTCWIVLHHHPTGQVSSDQSFIISTPSCPLLLHALSYLRQKGPTYSLPVRVGHLGPHLNSSRSCYAELLFSAAWMVVARKLGEGLLIAKENIGRVPYSPQQAVWFSHLGRGDIFEIFAQNYQCSRSFVGIH